MEVQIKRNLCLLVAFLRRKLPAAPLPIHALLADRSAANRQSVGDSRKAGFPLLVFGALNLLRYEDNPWTQAGHRPQTSPFFECYGGGDHAGVAIT